LAARLDVEIPAITKTYSWALTYHGGFTEAPPACLPANWPEEA
jgi:hypothetical protein